MNMNRKLKIGLVGILLLSIMIPAIVTVGSAAAPAIHPNSKNVIPPSPQQIQQANTITNKNVAGISKNRALVINNANSFYGDSNGLYLWISPGINDMYNWYPMTYVPLKVEVWDSYGNNAVGNSPNGVTVVSYLYYWNNGWQLQQFDSKNTGYAGDNARLTWILPSGNYWYSFIEGYYYDANNGYHYVYQEDFFNT